MKEIILKDFKLQDEEVLNIYPYGSYVYGTNNEKSDRDFILILKDGVKSRDELSSSYNNLNVTAYSESSFLEKLNLHRISALECFFLPKELMLKSTIEFSFKVKKTILWESVLEKSNKDISKAKKKMGEDSLTAKKSLFHSLRILDFATQITRYGTIVDYDSSNYIWEDLFTNPSESWDDYQSFQDLYEDRRAFFSDANDWRSR